jgi:hypothetical protein
VTDGPDVQMGLGAREFCLGHVALRSSSFMPV